MSKYRHQGFVLQGDSQEGVELELNFSSLRSNNNHSHGRNKNNHNNTAAPMGADSFSAADHTLYSVSSSDSWELDELEQKFDALKQIKKKKTVVEFDNVFDEDSFDDSDYYDNENGNGFGSRCMDRLRSSTISRKKIAMACLMVAMVAVGAVCLSLYIGQGSNNRGTTSSIISGDTEVGKPPNYTAGMTRREEDVFNILKDITHPDILADKSTVQNAAFLFVANDDELQVPTVDPDLVYRLHQRYILGGLYISTSGGNWTDSTNWMSATSECNWYGVICTDTLHVQQILLGTNNLVGEIFPEIGKFDSEKMLKIVLDHNKLSGSLPTELSHLKEMLQFEVDDNALTGSIDPGIFSGFKKMIRLELQYNSFTGTIPNTIGEMETIEKLHMYSNAFNGTIPVEIGGCSNLGWFLTLLRLYCSLINLLFILTFKRN